MVEIKTNLTPAKKRKTSSRAKGWYKRPHKTAELKAKWADPAYREKMRLVREANNERRKQDPAKFTRTGVPDGMRRRTAKRVRAKASAAADRFIQMLKDEGELPLIPNTDEGMAEAALKEAFILAIVPGDAKVKLGAINTVLNFTKSRPESKSKVTVETAEEWLKAAQADMKNG